MGDASERRHPGILEPGFSRLANDLVLANLSSGVELSLHCQAGHGHGVVPVPRGAPTISRSDRRHFFAKVVAGRSDHAVVMASYSLVQTSCRPEAVCSFYFWCSVLGLESLAADAIAGNVFLCLPRIHCFQAVFVGASALFDKDGVGKSACPGTFLYLSLSLSLSRTQNIPRQSACGQFGCGTLMTRGSRLESTEKAQSWHSSAEAV
mmetsp:Transcript_79746/g.174908  ORF Transcript_79746/g.174908 Transcript_79746/m.174908 type:complete len:207 (+) Transcript_79746:849-1469(+)